MSSDLSVPGNSNMNAMIVIQRQKPPPSEQSLVTNVEYHSEREVLVTLNDDSQFYMSFAGAQREGGSPDKIQEAQRQALIGLASKIFNFIGGHHEIKDVSAADFYLDEGSAVINDGETTKYNLSENTISDLQGSYNEATRATAKKTDDFVLNNPPLSSSSMNAGTFLQPSIEVVEGNTSHRTVQDPALQSTGKPIDLTNVSVEKLPAAAQPATTPSTIIQPNPIPNASRTAPQLGQSIPQSKSAPNPPNVVSSQSSTIASPSLSQSSSVVQQPAQDEIPFVIVTPETLPPVATLEMELADLDKLIQQNKRSSSVLIDVALQIRDRIQLCNQLKKDSQYDSYLLKAEAQCEAAIKYSKKLTIEERRMIDGDLGKLLDNKKNFKVLGRLLTKLIGLERLGIDNWKGREGILKILSNLRQHQNFDKFVESLSPIQKRVIAKIDFDAADIRRYHAMPEGTEKQKLLTSMQSQLTALKNDEKVFSFFVQNTSSEDMFLINGILPSNIPINANLVRAANEILTTELSYHESLVKMQSILESLRSAGIISKSEFAKLSMKKIIDMQNKLYGGNLKKFHDNFMTQDRSDSEKVRLILYQCSPEFLKKYAAVHSAKMIHSKSHSALIAEILERKNKNPQGPTVAEIIQPGGKGITLQSYAIQNVQRIPKFELFFRDNRKNVQNDTLGFLQGGQLNQRFEITQSLIIRINSTMPKTKIKLPKVKAPKA